MKRRHLSRAVPPLVIVLGVVAGIAVVRVRLDDDYQAFFMRAVMITFLGALALLAWFLLFGPGTWRRRGLVATAIGIVGVAVVACLRIDGVTGDLVPIVRLRWSDRTTLEPVPVPAAPESAALAGARDYPQFLGPDRDQTITGLALARDWDARPPRTLWIRPVGAGWSSFAVAGQRAITQEQHGDDELVVCYDLASGEPRWSHATSARYATTLGGTGPRATPTIDGDMVFALGGTGVLTAARLDDGTLLWSADTVRDGRTRENDWGMSGSPLVHDDLVIANAGGLLAYERTTGDVRWHIPDADAYALGSSYASPALLELDGRLQIVMINPQSASGHDPDTGQRLWTFAWPGRTPKVAQPIQVSANELVLSAGYGLGAVRVRLDVDADGAFQPGDVWRSRALKAKFTNLVLHDGFIYGLDDGILTCVDAATGRRRWKEGRYGHGQIVLVDDLILVMAESGDVILVEANADEPRELSRFFAIEGNTWNNPALAGRYLLTRNAEQAACFELPLAATSGEETP